MNRRIERILLALLALTAAAGIGFIAVYVTSNDTQLLGLSLGLASFRTLHHVQWNLVSAATILTMLPVIVLFFFAQRAFVQGVTLTGVKG